MSVARPTKWGNPFKVGAPHPDHGRPMNSVEAVELYRLHIGPMGAGEIPLQELAELIGRDLACFCPLDRPCHADVLLEAAVTAALHGFHRA